MSHALLCQAQMGYDMMNDDIGQDSWSIWLFFHEPHIGYLPPRVLNNLKTNKSTRQGFANLWLHIATCLEAGKVPNQTNVLGVVEEASEWPPATRNFLQRGGTVESVFLAVCRSAMEQDECTGSGEHQELFSEDIAKLPGCRNDLEFGYVSGRCGDKRISLTENVDVMGNPLDEDWNILSSLM